MNTKHHRSRSRVEHFYRRSRLPPRVFARTVILFLAFGYPVTPGVSVAQTGNAGEYQVKAAFLFHFAQFVEWPPGVFKDVNSPVTYCTLGEDPFQGALDQSLNGKIIGGRPVRVNHLKGGRDFHECQVLFIGTTEKKEMSATLAALKGAPILTVADADHFVNEGGVIGFCVEEKKIRFEINLSAATEAKLKLSAKLLSLAKTVIGDPRAN